LDRAPKGVPIHRQRRHIRTELAASYNKAMRVGVHYMTQMKRSAGCSTEVVETPDAPLPLREFLRMLADRHGPAFRTLLIDDAAEPRPSLLFFVGQEHAELSRLLNDGEVVTILAPMSGG
jgi:molybdopterin converting factor small subunit